MAPRSNRSNHLRIHRDTFGTAVDHMLVETKKQRTYKNDVFDNNNSRIVCEKTGLTSVRKLEKQSPQFEFRTQYAERDLMKNMLILAIGSLFVLTAFVALQNLQSSIYGNSGLGIYTLCLLYTISAFSCLYGPTLVQKICPNWTVILSFVMFAIFVSTHFYPAPYTIIPSTVILGLFYGPFLCAQSTFIILLASKYSSNRENVQDKVIQRFLRLFYFMYNSSQIWGNFISSIILSVGDTMTPVEQIPLVHHNTPVCEGEMHLNQLRTNSSLLFSISSKMSLSLVSSYLFCVLIGIAIIASLLDKIEMFVTQDPKERSHLMITISKILGSITGCKADKKLRYILPMVYFIGAEQGFMYADFTKVRFYSQ